MAADNGVAEGPIAGAAGSGAANAGVRGIEVGAKSARKRGPKPTARASANRSAISENVTVIVIRKVPP